MIHPIHPIQSPKAESVNQKTNSIGWNISGFVLTFPDPNGVKYDSPGWNSQSEWNPGLTDKMAPTLKGSNVYVECVTPSGSESFL